LRRLCATDIDAVDASCRASSFVRDAALAATRAVAVRAATRFSVVRVAAMRAFRFVLRLLATCAGRTRSLAFASKARTGVGAARYNDSAALAMLAITALPASNMLSRSNGPAALTVSRSGFCARIIFTLVGWQ